MKKYWYLLICILSLNLLAEEKKEVEIYDADGLYRFCIGLAKRNFYEQAEQEMKNFLKKYPEHQYAADIYIHLVEIQKKQKKYQQVYQLIDQFCQKWPQHKQKNSLLMIKAMVLIEEQKYEQAETILYQLSQLSDLTIQNAVAFYYANLMFRQEKYLKVIEILGEKLSTGCDLDFLKSVYFSYSLNILLISLEKENKNEQLEKLIIKFINEKNLADDLKEKLLFKLGIFYASQNKYRESLQQYEQLLIQYPNKKYAKDARLRRIGNYLNLKNYVVAIELSREWRERYQGEENIEFLFFFGNALTGIKNYEEALKEYDLIIKNTDATIQQRLYAKKAQLYCLLSAKQYDQVNIFAQELLSEKLNDQKFSNEIIYYAIYSLYAQQKYSEAISFVKNHNINFNSKDGYLILIARYYAKSLENIENYKQAFQMYEQIASLLDNQQEQVECWLQAGIIARKAKLFADAEKVFLLIIKKNTADLELTTRAMMGLSDVYIAQGKLKKAEQVIIELLDNSSEEKQVQYYWFLGYLQYTQGIKDEAEKNLRKVIELKGPTEFVILAKYYLATILNEKQIEEALAIYNDIYSLKEEFWPKIEEKNMLLLARFLFQNKRYILSEKICQKLLQSSDLLIRYQVSLQMADLFLMQNKIYEAKEILETQLFLNNTQEQQNINLGGLYALLGEVYMQSNEFDKAVKEFKNSLALCSDNERDYATRARCGLAEIYFSEKKYEQASQIALQEMVLGNNSYYTPKAMLIALKSHMLLNEMSQAFFVYQELKERYVLYFETIAQDCIIQDLLKWEKKYSENVEKIDENTIN